MTELLPPEVQRLLEQRAAAREARDWPTADGLRDRLRRLGWAVEDAPGGSTARPVLPAQDAPAGFARPEDLASLLDEPATVDSSLQVLADDHAGDLERLLRGLFAHSPSATWELVVVANAPDFDVVGLLDGLTPPIDPTVLPTSQRLGWADARNLGLRRSRGEVTILLDTSVEPTGDLVGPMLAAFSDPSVGIAGGWGVTSGDGRHFHEAPPGEVDAIEAYCLGVRRSALRAVGGFDHHFRFYRNADLDFSFGIRAAGWRAVSLPDLPLLRHKHRGYASLPHEERDRLSRRNFYRFLKHWGDRRDLLLHPDRDVGHRPRVHA